MVTQPYWITNQLAIVPRPRGGDWLEDEMLALRDAGIDVVASMLENAEAVELGLGEEEAASRHAGIEFLPFAIPDRDVPQDKIQFDQFLCQIEKHLADGKSVGVHCRACIGRASITSASLLIRSGLPSEAAWLQITTARQLAGPDTPEQRAWVDRWMTANR